MQKMSKKLSQHLPLPSAKKLLMEKNVAPPWMAWVRVEAPDAPFSPRLTQCGQHCRSQSRVMDPPEIRGFRMAVGPNRRL